MNYIAHSEKETFELGVEFGKNAKAGEVYALNGSLGSGKSVFARGFARGLGIEAPIPSPTFTVMNMYEEGRLAFYHFDVYRLADQSGDHTLESNGIERGHYGCSDNYALESIEAEDQLVDIGFFDYVSAGGVCLIEWALLVEGILPKDTIKINFKKHEGEADVRRIEVMNKGR